MIAVQRKGFPLAGMLSNVDIHSAKFSAKCLAKLSLNLSKPDIRSERVMTNDDIYPAQLAGLMYANVNVQNISAHFLNATNIDIYRAVISSFATSTRTREEFLESIKKGEYSAPALRLQASVDYPSGTSDFLRRSRRFASLRIDVAMYFPTVSPSSLVASINSMISFGTREATCVDLLLALPVATTDLLCNRWLAVYNKNQQIKSLKCLALLFKVVSTLIDSMSQETTKPGSVSPLTGPLTTNVISSNEVAVMNITTHPQGRNAYTLNSGAEHTSFIWLIAAVRRDTPTITAKIHHIAAESEQEARRTLAQDHICFFAGRIRLKEAAA